MNNLYIGKYAEDAKNDPNNGWLVGLFKADEPRRNSEVEIKYWEFPPGKTTHETKTSGIIECTFIIEGKTIAEIDSKQLVLEAGDYVVIKPGTKNNTVVKVIEHIKGLTIKAPSDPTAKKVVES